MSTDLDERSERANLLRNPIRIFLCGIVGFSEARHNHPSFRSLGFIVAAGLFADCDVATSPCACGLENLVSIVIPLPMLRLLLPNAQGRNNI